MKPTQGRIVIYNNQDHSDGPNDTYPAIIVAVEKESITFITLCVFGEYETKFRHRVTEGKKQGQWSWPKIK